jgi:hypothetical protein
MPAKYASTDAGLRLAMALLFLVSATTKVTETLYGGRNGGPALWRR